jgi:hypothetical protein
MNEKQMQKLIHKWMSTSRPALTYVICNWRCPGDTVESNRMTKPSRSFKRRCIARNPPNITSVGALKPSSAKKRDKGGLYRHPGLQRSRRRSPRPSQHRNYVPNFWPEKSSLKT